MKRFLLTCLFLAASFVRADDWPMWRHNPERNATSPETLPENLQLQWTHQLPSLKPAYRNRRLQFDRSYEPVILGQTLFVASSYNDSVLALDTGTGRERWRFFTGGPVRFAPVAGENKVWFGSDDGHVYCVDAESGGLVWKFRAVPSRRKLIGNGRLISVWPVRGGPVLKDGILYFAAGVWSFEGTFVYALDAATGEIKWVNDRSGFLYGLHPHGAQAFGGLSAQGYLLINGDDLVVPGGAAVPATFDLHTGRLKHFELPGPGRVPGAWFASVLKNMSAEGPRKSIVFDSALSTVEHEDNFRSGPGLPSVGSCIIAGEQTLHFTNQAVRLLKGSGSIGGEITSMAVAGGRVFVATAGGAIQCFAAKEAEPAVIGSPGPAPDWERNDERVESVRRMLQQAGQTAGYALVLGVGSGGVIEELIRQSDLHVVGVDPDPGRIEALRRRYDRAGLYGQRVSLIEGIPAEAGLPPYFASVITSEDGAVLGMGGAGLAALMNSLRPYGGTAWVPDPNGVLWASWSKLPEGGMKGAEARREDGRLVVSRAGALPGAVNYNGDWESPDPLVKAPLGVLWFDDALGHFKRSPQPLFHDGIMISQPKNWAKDQPRPFALLPAVYSDVYTGRVLSSNEAGRVEHYLPSRDASQKQPSQYRPPEFKGDVWNPPKPELGTRINPLTGLEERRDLIKSYGCDGGVDYGYLFTMRSGTAAFYDKRNESGTINISGPRSGCSNSIIPANGVLNVPYFFEGCTCSYPLPVGLTMVSMPPDHEQWTAWGPGGGQPMHRVGINFGAPGDRKTDEGTLWLDFPSVGGPSPDLDVRIVPAEPRPFYRHSSWIRGGRGWPWVVASGLEGLESFTLAGLQTNTYTVRLHFVAPELADPVRRIFNLTLQGREVLKEFDVVAEAGGSLRGVVKEFRDIRSEGTLTVGLSALTGSTVISGMEVIAGALPAGEIPVVDRPQVRLLTRGGE